jgi:hypothetical protein
VAGPVTLQRAACGRSQVSPKNIRLAAASSMCARFATCRNGTTTVSARTIRLYEHGQNVSRYRTRSKGRYGSNSHECEGRRCVSCRCAVGAIRHAYTHRVVTEANQCEFAGPCLRVDLVLNHRFWPRQHPVGNAALRFFRAERDSFDEEAARGRDRLWSVLIGAVRSWLGAASATA